MTKTCSLDSQLFWKYLGTRVPHVAPGRASQSTVGRGGACKIIDEEVMNLRLFCNEFNMVSMFGNFLQGYMCVARICHHELLALAGPCVHAQLACG